jgi:hypothetical protein
MKNFAATGFKNYSIGGFFCAARFSYGAEALGWPEKEVAKMKNSKVLISVLFPRVFPLKKANEE